MNAHVRKNRAHWDRIASDYRAAHVGHFSVERFLWGAWGLPESEVGALGEVRGLDVLEIGCGGGHGARALAGQGARVTAVDVAPGRLAEARSVVGDRVRLVEADAEALPFTDASFDLVYADHGAPTFCDPDVLLPQIVRVLRPRGRFVFNHLTPLLDACWDGHQIGRRLASPMLGVNRLETEDEVTFPLTWGAWIRCFRRHGFEVLDLIELRPPADLPDRYANFASSAWAHDWPAEEIWVVRRRD